MIKMNLARKANKAACFDEFKWPIELGTCVFGVGVIRLITGGAPAAKFKIVVVVVARVGCFWAPRRHRQTPDDKWSPIEGAKY